MERSRVAVPAGKRAIVFYALGIVVPALVLLAQGLISIRREGEAARALRSSNLLLERQNLASALESRTEELARTALGDPELSRIPEILAGSPPLTAGRKVRAIFDSIRDRYPLAERLFAYAGGRVVYPVLRGVPAREQDDTEFYGALDEAEMAEMGEGQTPDALSDALEGYRHSLLVATNSSDRALALLRVARCLRKLGRTDEAKALYVRLFRQFGSDYDPFYRPYSLVAGFELGEAGILHEARERLETGAWEVDGETLDYYLARFGGAESASPYVRQFRIAAAIEAALGSHTPDGDRIDSFSFTAPGGGHELFSVRTGGGSGIGDVTLVMDASIEFVAGRLLNEVMKGAGIAEPFHMLLRGSGVRPVFSRVFTPWDLVPTEPDGPARDWMGTWGFVGVGFLVLAVLTMGVFLLFRDTSRQAAVTRLQSNLVTGVAHDLGTPLTIIQIYVEMLRDSTAFSAAERGRFSQIVIGETSRLARLMNKVLAFSKAERNCDRYALKRTDLAARSAEVLATHALHWTLKGFVLETAWSDEPVWVDLDEESFGQALLNLVDNAAKYSGDSRWIGVRVYTRADEAVLEVEDRGLGIRTEERERIFDEFYRGAAGPEKGGCGLGLFLVRRAMNAHRGRVEVESEPRRGSRFRLIFPCVKS